MLLSAAHLYVFTGANSASACSRGERHQPPSKREGCSRWPAVPRGGSSVRGARPVHAEQLHLSVERARAHHGRYMRRPRHLVAPLSGLTVAAEHLGVFLLFVTDIESNRIESDGSRRETERKRKRYRKEKQ